MLPDRVSNPGPRTYESGALPIALRGPAKMTGASLRSVPKHFKTSGCLNYYNYIDLEYIIKLVRQ